MFVNNMLNEPGVRMPLFAYNPNANFAVCRLQLTVSGRSLEGSRELFEERCRAILAT